MKKAVTIAALASLALANNDFEDDNFNVIKTLGNDIKKAGHFVAQHPQIITQGAKLLAHDDELITVGGCIPPRRIPGQSSTLPKKPLGPNPSEGKTYPLGWNPQLAEKYRKSTDSAPAAQQQDDELIVVGGCTKGRLAQKIPFVPSIPVSQEQDDELFNIGGLINDGVNIYKDIKTHNYGGLINHGIQTVKDIKRHDDNDDEFFSLRKDGAHSNEMNRLGDMQKFIHTVQQIMDANRNQMKKTVKNFRDDADDELHATREEVERRLENQRQMESMIRNQMRKQKEITQAILNNTNSRSSKNIKSIRKSKKDDEDYEFYTTREVAEKKLKQERDMQRFASDASKKQKSMAQAVVNNIRHKKDDEDDELFNLGGLIKDGVNIYKDIKAHNYGDLVNHGIQTVKDMKQATHGKRFLNH